MKPYVGKVFNTLKEGEKFYIEYGVSCGFGTRMATVVKYDDDTIVWRYIVCNKEGVKKPLSNSPSNSQSIITKRRRMSTRSGCRARVAFRLDAAVGYVVSMFVEGHNHQMVSDGYKHLMKCNRKISAAHEMMLAKCRRANIGPMRSFRLFKELVGTFEDVGCTAVEFKNYARDMRAFSNGVDAEILLQKLERKREFCIGFKFEYQQDEWNQVKSIFWADSLSIVNYHIFGEVVSFDATYSTNRYKIIFAPFTGKDNHGKCVTFGVGLLTREDFESYSWLLTKFVECMNFPPKMLITDEDPALKKVVAVVLPNTRHRFCMWYIMLKVAEKVPSSLNEDPDFKQRFNNIVWSEINEPPAFDKLWNEFINDYGLSSHKWFSKMFSLRSFWISAYFRDCEMSGLFKTTSLSESENSFFRQYLNANADLAEFYIHFGSALDAQRNTHDQFSYKDETGIPDLKMHFPIERHAASIYTYNIFLKVQDEIEAAIHQCRILSMIDQYEFTSYSVVDKDGCIFEVVRYVSEDSISCSCKYYTRNGLLCSHIFLMMLNMNVKEIPEKYICKRWTKYSCSDIIRERNNSRYSDGSGNNELFFEACKCIGLVDGDPERKAELLVIFKEASAKFSVGVHHEGTEKSKDAMFEHYYGSSKPSTVRLLPPPVVSTKGSANRKKSNREKAIEAASKPKRKCRKCNTLTNYDSRNCPVNNKD